MLDGPSTIRLVISLEDHGLPLICKTPTNCQHITALSLSPLHWTASCFACCSKHLWTVAMCDQGTAPNCKAHFLYQGHTHPIKTMSTRVIVLLVTYKYLKRCLPLIYSINCRTQITSTLDYMWGNECADWNGSQSGSHCCCCFECTAEDLIEIGIFEAENFSTHILLFLEEPNHTNSITENLWKQQRMNKKKKRKES